MVILTASRIIIKNKNVLKDGDESRKII